MRIVYCKCLEYWRRSILKEDDSMDGKSGIVIRVAIIAAASVMIWVGIARQEPGIVLKKATNICMECIGLG